MKLIGKLLICSALISVPAFSQTIRLQCVGSGSGTNTQGTKNFNFQSYVEFNQSTNYFRIENLNEVAPGSSFPYQEVAVGNDEIHFKTKNSFLGGNGPTFGKLNRYTGQLTIEYLNAGNPAGMVSTSTNAVCSTLNQRQF